MLKLYNSLSKSIEEFKPLSDEVRIYSCGPTVYDFIHIGNLSSFIFADNLNRALEIDGYKSHHVMNITDVDDKTIKRSQEDYPEDAPEQALKKLTEQYEISFKSDIETVGIRVNFLNFIKATDSIKSMQDLILYLLDHKIAYISDDGIYFSIENYQKDGKKYGQLLDLDIQNTSKARINNDEYDKHSTHDFALWKFRRPNEPAWSFMINDKDYEGRPGWHIECSAMSSKLLGQPFDIHTGGIDLIFPHHENEIAQSTAANSNPLYAKYFVHNEHLLIDKKKMSKSLGNIFSLVDLKEHGFEPLTFRLLILQSHYRNQANFSWEILESAKTRLIDLRSFTALVHQTKDSVEKVYDFEKIKNDLKDAYLDDLNSPKVLAILSVFQNEVVTNLVSNDQKDQFKNFIEYLDLLLGLDLANTKDISEEQRELISKREVARNNKDFNESDKLRDKINLTGISLRDTSYGQIWYYI